jgi:hypothetical protein
VSIDTNIPPLLEHAPLIPYEDKLEIQPRRDATVMELASIIAGSRDFPECRTPEKAAVRILAGREMGVGPIASIIGIRVQAGRVSMDAALMAGCIERSEMYAYKVMEHTPEKCLLHFFKKSPPGLPSTDAGPMFSEFTMADAHTAGLDQKAIWKAYPRNMLFARALSNGARWFCAGIFGGSIYNHEELGIAVDEDGRAIEDEVGGGAGNELCTRDQRQEIARLVEAVGDSMPGFLAQIGIKLLDELSQYEAVKEIKKLEKRLAKSNGKKPVVNMAEAQPAASSTPLTDAQQIIADAEAEAAQPSTERQREQIINLAERLCPDEKECHVMLVNALEKRGCKMICQLDHLQAAALIENIRRKLEENPPFDPSPNCPGNSQ